MRIKGARLIVLLVLALDNTPNISTYQLSARTGYSPNTVCLALRSLEQDQLIQVSRAGWGKRNSYRLQAEAREIVSQIIGGGNGY